MRILAPRASRSSRDRAGPITARVRGPRRPGVKRPDTQVDLHGPRARGLYPGGLSGRTISASIFPVWPWHANQWAMNALTAAAREGYDAFRDVHD